MLEPAPESQKFQRRVVLVKRSLQLKYVGMVFLSVLFASMFVGGDVYYTIVRAMLRDNLPLPAEVGQFHALLLAKIALYLVIMLMVSLYVSHRFAGPIYRFEKSAQTVAGGDLTHRVSLRTGDELLELQEEFNGMLASLQTLVQKDRALSEHLGAKVDAILKKLPAGGDAAAARADLESLKLELRHLTSAFKI